MPSTDWVPIVVAVVAGAGSGIGAAWLTPFAQRRAQEAKDRTSAQRLIISNGRALVVQAFGEGWGVAYIPKDPRYWNLRRHLPKEVHDAVVDGTASAMDLLDAIDALEKGWRLV